MSVIKILAFDPAMGVTGWSVLTTDLFNPIDCTVTKFGSIKPAAVVSKVAFRDEVELYGRSTVSLGYLREQVALLIEEHKPDYIAVEDTYLDPHRPTAYASLLQWICAVKLICREKYKKPLFLISTKTAKHAVTGKGSSGKLAIQEAILTNPNIKFRQKVDATSTELTEHVADSIAVGAGFIFEVLPGRDEARMIGTAV